MNSCLAAVCSTLLLTLTSCDLECGRYYPIWERKSDLLDAGRDGGEDAGRDGGEDAGGDARVRPCLSGFRERGRFVIDPSVEPVEWLASTHDGLVWYSRPFMTSSNLGALDVARARLETLDDPSSPSGLAAAEDAGVWVGYADLPSSLRYVVSPDPGVPADLRAIYAADDQPRQGLALDSLGRLWWIQRSDFQSTYLTFVTPGLLGGEPRTPTAVPNRSGLILELVRAFGDSVWYAGSAPDGGVSLGRVLDLDGGLQDERALVDIDGGLLVGTPLDLTVGPDRTVHLLVRTDFLKPLRFLVYEARETEAGLALRARELVTGEGRGLTFHERCGVVISHDRPYGLTLLEPDGGLRELTLPEQPLAPPDAAVPGLGRLVYVPGGLVLAEQAPAAIVLLRGEFQASQN